MGRKTRDDSLTGAPELLEHWRRWQGAVDCQYTGKIWPASELRDLSARAAAQFADAGLRQGDVVALVLSNTAAFPVSLMGLLGIGCNPLLVYAATREVELNRIVAAFGIRHGVHDFAEGLSGLPRAAYPEAGRVGVGNLCVSVLRTADRAGDTVFHLPASGVILHPTSGTYGASQYCVRNQRVAVAEGRNYVDTIDLYRAIRITVTTPLSHAYAYGFGLVAAVLTDSTLALDVAFNPKRILRLEKERPGGILAIVPPMANSLVQLGERDPARRMAKAVFYAGAPCDPALAKQFEATFGASLFAIYGTTETGAITSSHAATGATAGVGPHLNNVEVAIRNCSPYTDLGDGVGEIFVKATSMMQCYTRDVDAPEPIEYWRTGDLGFMDEAGCVTIVGRIRDVINLGGMKVDPSEVESVLLAHRAIADAAVYPGLRKNGDEFVQAAVHMPGKPIGPEELRRYCLEQLDAHKVPVAFHVVDEIPRTPSGKCMKIHCPGFPEQFVTQ